MDLRSGSVYIPKCPILVGRSVLTPAITTSLLHHSNFATMSNTTSTITTTTATITTTTATMATTATGTITTPSSSTTMFSPQTIKLLHQDPSVPKFGGEDPSYSALTFLTNCEDVMANSNVSSGADKISFIRSQLLPSSLASDMMTATCFHPRALNYDYDKFRSNFLRAFGIAQTQDCFQWSFRLAEALSTQLGSAGHMRGLARAADIINEAVESLQGAGWIENGVLSTERFRLVMEFQLYISFLNPQERRVASSLSFNIGESLLDFAAKLRKKLSEMPRASPSVTFAPVVQSGTPPSPPPSTSRPSTPPTRPSCTYCSRPGHLVSQCFKRQRDMQPNGNSSCSYCNLSGHTFSHCYQRQRDERSSSDSSRGRSQYRRPSQRHSSQYRSPSPGRSQSSPSGRPQMKFERPPKYCLIHDRCNHSSEDCTSIQKMRRDQTVNAKPSHFRHRRQDHFKN